MAEHAIRLARLDPLVRRGVFDRHFEVAPPEDVEDIVQLLSASPVPMFVDADPLLLNPSFGESSIAIGGADVDILAGKGLIDIKVTTRCAVSPGVLDQLLGYILLCRNERGRDGSLPDIRQTGLLFPRQGYLWTVEFDEWTVMPGFNEFEQWFRTYLAQRAHGDKKRPQTTLKLLAANGPDQRQLTRQETPERPTWKGMRLLLKGEDILVPLLILVFGVFLLIAISAPRVNVQVASSERNGVARSMAAIREHATQAWVKPAGTPSDLSCEVSVSLSASGEVLSAVIDRSSGNPTFDRSAIAAIYGASPFPVPAGRKVVAGLRHIDVKFGPIGKRQRESHAER